MEPGTGRNKVTKRSSNACVRCRRQKIKCSGSQPCDACGKRKQSCTFDERDQRIVVTRGYIIDLQQRIERWERSKSTNEPARDSIEGGQAADKVESGSESDVSMAGAEGPDSTQPSRGTEKQQDARPKPPMDPVASTLINPLSTGQSEFMTAPTGRIFYLGTSSNWSFTRRVLNITHQYINKTPLPTSALIFDAAAYTLDWDGYRIGEGPEMPALPTQDYAIYLVNAVKFHCSQMFHLFDEESFMKSLYHFYSDPNPRADPTDLWFIHFLLILAFGKAFTTKANRSRKPPGHDYFIKAVQLLPDLSVLLKQAALSIEILCSLALYMQCVDFRHASHNFIGQAIRMALGEGMHTDMPTQVLGEAYVERCRRIWYTAHILDREMTSLFGLPPSIHDDYVQCQLPTYSGSSQRTAALRMRIKLSEVIGSINRKVYGRDGRLNNKFMLGTKTVLESMAHVANDLQQSFALPLERDTSCISRTSAHLHLLHHQCIVLATRPLLFCFLKIRFESESKCTELLGSSQTVRNLIQMCMDSSQQMIAILDCLQSQGLLETFLPFDLEAIFVSTGSLLLGPAIDPQAFEGVVPSLEKAYAVFDEMIAAGNAVANFQKAELQQLEIMLQQLTQTHPQPATDDSGAVNEAPCQQQQQQIADDTSPHDTVISSLATDLSQNESYTSSLPGNLEEMTFDSGLTMTQLLDMANSIEHEDTEWMSQTIVEHSIW
ncbi:putative transcriptional regulatory protein [Colletotrichum fructicola]|nr:putative transcriptional regulatory protein [Colletotrichum fructicola Nara gc5]KAF4884363.1 putative transcriptional regulatory protein [Colletotrichum fructicola]KAF4908963.1 putative transcriptional regulatory protein [Colletotrichum fructicola]KAF4937732.1 putative transcriptional regulatory protein [Colletotrichum fructicola]KAF5509063.1 putative transcriptional regulatory protein [Colletotrichum fructicola]